VDTEIVGQVLIGSQSIAVVPVCLGVS
jgi:hypothetical protein